jgi:L-rhamnose isomerase
MPHESLREMQDSGQFSRLMVSLEELKTLPFGAIWDEYLVRQGVSGAEWFQKVEQYERDVLSNRV